MAISFDTDYGVEFMQYTKGKERKEGRESMEGRSHKKEREGGKETNKRNKERKKTKLEWKKIYLKNVKENILA